MRRSESLAVALALLAAASPASAQELGWTTACSYEEGPIGHLAIMGPATAAAGGREEPLGEIDCFDTVHRLTVLERRPASVASLTLVELGLTCVVPVTEDLVVRVDSSREDGVGGHPIATFLAHAYDASGCRVSDATLAIVGGAVSSRSVTTGGAPPADVVAAVPAAPASCGELPAGGFEVPELRAWLVFVCNRGDAYLVRDARILATPDQLRHVSAVLQVGGRTLIEATDLDTRHWLGEVRGESLVAVVAGGTELELLAALRTAEGATYQEVADAGAREDLSELLSGITAAACTGIFTLLCALGLAYGAHSLRKQTPESRPRSWVATVLAAWLLLAYGVTRIGLGALVAFLGTVVGSATGGGWFPTPDAATRSRTMLLAVGGGLAMASGLFSLVGVSVAVLRGRARSRIVVGLMMLFALAAHASELAIATGTPGAQATVYAVIAGLGLLEIAAFAVLALLG